MAGGGQADRVGTLCPRSEAEGGSRRQAEQPLQPAAGNLLDYGGSRRGDGVVGVLVPCGRQHVGRRGCIKRTARYEPEVARVLCWRREPARRGRPAGRSPREAVSARPAGGKGRHATTRSPGRRGRQASRTRSPGTRRRVWRRRPEGGGDRSSPHLLSPERPAAGPRAPGRANVAASELRRESV